MYNFGILYITFYADITHSKSIHNYIHFVPFSNVNSATIVKQLHLQVNNKYHSCKVNEFPTEEYNCVS